MSYLIHDNGSRPFKVKISNNPKLIEIYKEKKMDSGKYDKLLLSITNFRKVFVGSDFLNHEFTGNSILVQITNHHYIFIGWEVYAFTTEDVIREYYSTVGNSDVPYPYAIGDKNTYLMIENVFINNTLFKNYEDCADPYEVYYSQPQKKYKNIGENHKMKFRILIKRISGPPLHIN